MKKMLSTLRQLGTNMSNKVDFLLSLFDRFPYNLGDHSEKQEEIYQQGIKVMEEK